MNPEVFSLPAIAGDHAIMILLLQHLADRTV